MLRMLFLIFPLTGFSQDTTVITKTVTETYMIIGTASPEIIKSVNGDPMIEQMKLSQVNQENDSKREHQIKVIDKILQAVPIVATFITVLRSKTQ